MMLEKPDLEDEKIISRLESAHDLGVESLAFLPLGADVNSAVYRVEAQDGLSYFLKLRSGEFHAASVRVPRFLADQGFTQAIPPLPTRAGDLWADLPPYRLILYPFVEGRHAYQHRLTEAQWLEFGAALKRFHTTQFPGAVTTGTPFEDFSPRWRQEVRGFLERLRQETFQEPAAVELADFLRIREPEIQMLLRRAERLALRLQGRPLVPVLCHGDIHGWNLLIDDPGRLYIVDWDTLLFAPKERDLMFIGSGLGGSGRTPQEEEALFHRGYGRTAIEPEAIAYYRTERILEDLATYCGQIFSSDEGGADRAQAVQNVKSNFLPGGTVERAAS